MPADWKKRVRRTGVMVREKRAVITLPLLSLLGAMASFSVLATGSITLTWEPISDPSVVGYKIYSGPASRSYTNIVLAGLATNAVISGLIDGASYYFAATAYDSSGAESDFSDEAYWGPPPNQPPTLDALNDMTLNEGAGSQTVNLSGISAGATNETPTLTVSATSSNPGFIPDPVVAYTSPDPSGSLIVTPAAKGFGSALITVTVNDGQAQNNTTARTFSVTVNDPAINGANLSRPPPGPKIALATNGNGGIFPRLSTQILKAGKTYALTAVPAKGQEFAGWTGSITSSTAKLTLVLTSNLLLEADFIPSPFIPISGTYSGLFVEADSVRPGSSGWFAVSASRRGAYSGHLQIGASRYSFSGRLNLQCQARRAIERPGDDSMTLDLQLGSGGQADQVSGRLSDGRWVASLWGDRVVFDGRLNPCPHAGSYTFVIPGGGSDPAVPTGDGFGAVRVTPAGMALLVGRLADGARFTQNAPVSKQGLWPLYASLYSGKGSLWSWLTFTNQTGDDFNGELSWIKPADARMRYYPAGFASQCAASGSRYVQPSSATDKILDLTNAKVEFLGGNLAVNFTNLVAFEASNRSSNQSNDRLNLSFSRSTGTFKGMVTDPSSGYSLPFSGVVFQKLDTGYGFLMGADRSSRVLLTP